MCQNLAPVVLYLLDHHPDGSVYHLTIPGLWYMVAGPIICLSNINLIPVPFYTLITYYPNDSALAPLIVM